jgi:CheY-like chemotaxis protein
MAEPDQGLHRALVVDADRVTLSVMAKLLANEGYDRTP